MKVFAKMTVGQIGIHIRENDLTPAEIDCLLSDYRAGVRRLARNYIKKQEEMRRKKNRLEALFAYERRMKKLGYTYIAGVDEAGRGPLAGPVTAAAVILPEKALLLGLNDSKKLSPQKREELYREITAQAIDWAVGYASVNEIDRYNILQATKLAMKRAIYALRQKPDYILIDAVEIDELKWRQQAITGGDALSATIAAASIIAKVTRDRLMCELDRQYPVYGFAEHKGYPTRRHREAITKYGPCPLHRRSFLQGKEGEMT